MAAAVCCQQHTNSALVPVTARCELGRTEDGVDVVRRNGWQLAATSHFAERIGALLTDRQAVDAPRFEVAQKTDTIFRHQQQ